VEEDKGGRVITCLRCQLKVRVTIDSGGLKLSYDVEHWSKRCYCANLSPADCCSFFGLQDKLNKLPRSPNG